MSDSRFMPGVVPKSTLEIMESDDSNGVQEKFILPEPYDDSSDSFYTKNH